MVLTPKRYKPRYLNPWRNHAVSEEHRHVYAKEAMMNFRFISKLCASTSDYTLNDSNLASTELKAELSDLGQFAELTYVSLPIESMLDPANREMMLSEYYPLEGCEALRDVQLVKVVIGDVADLVSFVAYRPQLKQLVAAISGTANFPQAWQDLNIRRHTPKHWNRESVGVHNGFWGMFKGIKNQMVVAIKEGLATHSGVTEIAIVGHSMGGAIASFLSIHLMNEKDLVPKDVTLKLIAFGAPRCVNQDFARKYWPQVVDSYCAVRGEHAFIEYSVKAFNDGVPSIPPAWLGYRHFIRNNLYLAHNKLYHTPLLEAEHSLFNIEGKSKTDKTPLFHALGGHNYYNGRDMERLMRRALRFGKDKETGEGWQGRYEAWVYKNEKYAKRLKLIVAGDS